MRIASYVVVCALILSCFVFAAPPVPQSPNPSQQQPGLFLGTAWYPEQWPESRWETDLQLMQEAHIRFVRVGEFAWSTMEPQEGQYRFEWLEKAVAVAQKHGIYVVLGTPTAAPPAWLTSKYPDTLRIEEDGQRAEARRPAAFRFRQSERYRQFCRADRRRDGKALWAQSRCDWVADRQRVRDVLLRSGDAAAVPAMAEDEIRNAGQPESALDDGVLERDLRQLGRDSDSGWLQQSRSDAGAGSDSSAIPTESIRRIRST